MHGIRFSSIACLVLTASMAAQNLETATVVLANSAARTVRLPAELEPYQKVSLRARVTGIVEKVLVDRGSVVKEGDLLIDLSAPEMKAQIAEAESRVRVFEAQKLEAQARAAASRSTLERLRTASSTPGAVAGNDIVQLEKSVEAAEALAGAMQRSADAASSQVNALKEMEVYLKIRAPFPGVITQRLVHPGALAGPTADALLEIEQVTRLRLVVPVPEIYAGNLPLGSTVTFSVPAFAGEVFRGTVARKSASFDPKSRTMLVEADVTNANLTLAPGMFADVQWPVRTLKSALVVPATAVVTTTERVFVIRVKSGKAEYVPVTKLQKEGEGQVVMGGLAAGDIVLKRGSDEIREGAVIR